jgi:hypothetical protein
MEQASQRLIVIFMLLLPALVIAGLVCMVYEKVFSRRNTRRERHSIRHGSTYPKGSGKTSARRPSSRLP